MNNQKNNQKLLKFSAKIVIIMMLLVIAINRAEAEDIPGMPDPTVFYLPVGINLGSSGSIFDGGDRSFHVGGELSTAWFSQMSYFWYGAYTDFLYLPEVSEYRYSIGPEAGYKLFGFDCGYHGVVSNSKYYHGVVARVLVTAPFVHPYFRFGYVFNQTWYAEFGVLVKYPFNMSGGDDEEDFTGEEFDDDEDGGESDDEEIEIDEEAERSGE
ncbi:MAG: hypothetical protein GY754_18350 [bacterium]|nr:hypothetical protein [bacterium]